MTKTVGFTETILRDAQQSLIATRMPTSDMLPILGKLDEAGYDALECWGGATFDACLRYLNEDPWERLRLIRKGVKHTKLMMLLRGQNLLGYKNYPDDVVSAFVTKSVENGIDIIRVFDALNDPRNLQQSITACKNAGGHCQPAICYTTSEFHTLDYYVKLVEELMTIGADSIAIKDMAGILTPQRAYELVSSLKDKTLLPIEVHTHATSGIAEMTYLKAVEAGADIIDTAISPLAGGTSQPATESLAIALSEMGYQTGLDIEKLNEIAAYFAPVRDKFRASGQLNAKMKDVQPKTLTYQVPGGMLSNLYSQLKEQGMEQHYDAVLAEVPKVRADLGYPPLVTPLSQMVGTQSLMNIITGERYKMVPTEIKDYLAGHYGKSPGPIDLAFRKKIIGDTPVITTRPADSLQPQMAAFKAAASPYAKTTEDVLIYGLFPDSGKAFLGRREDPFYDVPIQEAQVTIELD